MPLAKYPPARPSPEKSAAMRRVRTAHTDPERRLARMFRRLGAYPTRHPRAVIGRPDFAFVKARVALFVDGDFWHGARSLPKTNTDWWREKLARTVERDARQTAALETAGWVVLRVLESEIKRGALHVAAFVLLVRRLRGE